MPSGMQPVLCNKVAFLWNADVRCGYNFLPNDIPYGNGLVVNSSGTVVQSNHYYPFGMAFADTPIANQGLQPPLGVASRYTELNASLQTCKTNL